MSVSTDAPTVTLKVNEDQIRRVMTGTDYMCYGPKQLSETHSDLRAWCFNCSAMDGFLTEPVDFINSQALHLTIFSVKVLRLLQCDLLTPDAPIHTTVSGYPVWLTYFDFDSGWFTKAGAAQYQGNANDPKQWLSLVNSLFDTSIRRTLVWSSIIGEWLTHIVGSSVDMRSQPVIHAAGKIAFSGNYCYVRGLVLTVMYPEYDQGYKLDVAAGTCQDLCDGPIENPTGALLAFGVNPLLGFGSTGTQSNPQVGDPPQWARVPQGMSLFDYARDCAKIALLNAKIADSVDWDSDLSCSDSEAPFALVIGSTIDPRRFGDDPAHVSPAPLQESLAINQQSADILAALRDRYRTGTRLRANGLALTTTTKAVKSDDHILLEVLSKGTAVSSQRKEKQPGYHKRVYDVYTAGECREQLKEGQPGWELAWVRLLQAGSLMESWREWFTPIKAAAKKEAKRRSEDLPGNWHPYSESNMRVTIQVISGDINGCN